MRLAHVPLQTCTNCMRRVAQPSVVQPHARHQPAQILQNERRSRNRQGAAPQARKPSDRSWSLLPARTPLPLRPSIGARPQDAATHEWALPSYSPLLEDTHKSFGPLASPSPLSDTPLDTHATRHDACASAAHGPSHRCDGRTRSPARREPLRWSAGAHGPMQAQQRSSNCGDPGRGLEARFDRHGASHGTGGGASDARRDGGAGSQQRLIDKGALAQQSLLSRFGGVRPAAVHVPRGVDAVRSVPATGAALQASG